MLIRNLVKNSYFQLEMNNYLMQLKYMNKELTNIIDKKRKKSLLIKRQKFNKWIIFKFRLILEVAIFNVLNTSKLL